MEKGIINNLGDDDCELQRKNERIFRNEKKNR